MRVRNAFYDNGLFEKERPALRVISVGNLTVGGTGKTPLVEFLIKRYLPANPDQLPQTATLSRGYGRKTKGFRVADGADTAQTLGDEPVQIYRKFGRLIRVCVGERRADALRQMQQLFPQLRQVLLDDAYQHRAVDPHLNLLLSDFNRPFYTDYPFPAGRLRESRSGAKRADAVIITKCPDTLSSIEHLGFDLSLGNAMIEDTPPPPTRAVEKAKAKAHAKTYRKARRGERRARGSRD